ncbi:MAG: phosphoglucomutase [Flavobacteriaceae bacterium]|nr:phosphoglucomutase [Flavobacteriaceae bacterium]|tara:strand:- start:897 stop:2603 length:1707 start_codon:yes stop_codon:yes gene_type:complete
MGVKSRMLQWQKSPFDSDTQKQVAKLYKFPEKAEDAFYKDLEFGTGGMRGIMGVGTNRINKYTLGKNTQGLSNYLLEQYKNEKVSVVIAFDCRNQSKYLAKVCADIFTANNIKCYLFSDLRPTPELSFAVRYLNAQCGIVLTASHNPPEYNGYKVYGKDGGQLVPPHDEEVCQKINKTAFQSIKFKGNSDLLDYIDKEIDLAYQKDVLNSALFDNSNNKQLKIVFSPIHGTSITALPQVLEKAGYKKVSVVKEQIEPNGNFPTVVSANPEEKEALKIAVTLATKKQADIVIGTDPDADRFALVVKDQKSNWYYLNGNQTMVVLTEFLLQKRSIQKKINKNCFVASTIVSTPLIQKIAMHYNVEYKSTLTGFKWIAKLIEDFPDLEFIGGGEESFGFLIGDSVRDKDAISASLLACEIANEALKNGSSFFELLIKCYKKYGLYKEKLISITKKGKSGSEFIAEQMETLRDNPPKTIGGSPVIILEDYLKLTAYNFNLKEEKSLQYSSSNVLIFKLEDGSKIALRPSGTEPKIKYYFSVNRKFDSKLSWNDQEKFLEKRLKQLSSAILAQ